jgi:hypothetical protein
VAAAVHHVIACVWLWLPDRDAPVSMCECCRRPLVSMPSMSSVSSLPPYTWQRGRMPGLLCQDSSPRCGMHHVLVHVISTICHCDHCDATE